MRKAFFSTSGANFSLAKMSQVSQGTFDKCKVADVCSLSVCLDFNRQLFYGHRMVLSLQQFQANAHTKKKNLSV